MPQSLEDMKVRYLKALESEYDCDKPLLIRPGEKSEHIFDWFDGLRLIISKDKLNNRVSIHVSASFTEDSQIYKELKSRKCCENIMIVFVKMVEERFKLLDNRQLEFIGFSNAGIPHWITKTEN